MWTLRLWISCLLIFATLSHSTLPSRGDLGPVTIVNETTGDSANPEIAVSSDNDIYVVWEKGVTSREVLIGKSQNGGESFASETNVSNDTVDSREPAITVSSDNDIYVAWERGGLENDILFAKSQDGGESFSLRTNVSNDTGDSANPEIAVSSDNVIYVVWQDTATNSILLAKSQDGGNYFDEAIPVTLANARNPDITTFGTQEVFVTWEDNSSFEIIAARSEDSGTNFTPQQNISDDAQLSTEPVISVSTSGIIYIAWTSTDEEIGVSEILLANGAADLFEFGAPLNLSPFDSAESFQPYLADSRSTDAVFIGWTDLSLSTGDIFLTEIAEPPQASLTLVGDIITEPRWGLDAVMIEGIAGNFEAGDSVTINWGDGSNSPDLEILPDGSWSESKLYGSDAVTSVPLLVRAFLVDTEGNQKAESAPVFVTVQKHVTKVHLDRVSSVKEGQLISVTGVLFDTSTSENVGILGRNVTFSTTGASVIAPVLTEGEGIFTSSGLALDPGVLQTIQPIFEGDSLYHSTAGNIMPYNIVENSTAEADLLSASPSQVTLSDFGISVTFDNVLESGKIFIADCEAPDSTRYVELDLCFVISPSAKLGEESKAHIEVSLNGTSIPSVYQEDQIGLFYEGLAGIIEITQSRNLVEKSVLGETEEFGRFIVGIALHDPQSSNSIRKEILVGEDKTISTEGANASLDKEEYEASDTALVTVVDISANIDILSRDSVSVNISSTTSHPDSITLELLETEPNTGMFRGTFTFTGGPSSSDKLQIKDGDELSITYHQAAARVTAKFESVSAAGKIDVFADEISIPGPIIPFTSPIRLKLVDAEMEPLSTSTITMSFRDVNLNNADPDSLRLLRQISEGDDWVDITLPNGEGHDLSEMTITGRVSLLGTFVISCDVDQTHSCAGGPGGAGGGPVKAGVVVLDSVASVRSSTSDREESDERSGNSRGGGPRSTTVTQPLTGANVRTSVTTESGTVVLSFDEVNQEKGQVRVNSEDIRSFGGLFFEIASLKDDNEHGLTNVDGKTYATSGNIFDIDTSSLQFTGLVEVTIPFDEESASLLNSESSVRLLHFDEVQGRWEDKTVSLDTDSNTVTGLLESLSPVVAAVILEGHESEHHPEDETSLRFEIAVPSIAVRNNTITVSTDLYNAYTQSQAYVMIVQVLDENGVAQHIDWHASRLQPNSSSPVSISWNKTEEGVHTVQVFLLTDLENPWLLAEPLSSTLEIS